MVGLDIEDWRSELGLSKYQAQHALGFRNSNHYNTMCLQPNLPVVLELLIRIYDESPIALGWGKYSLKELFQIMYGDTLDLFVGGKQETHAKVDLGTRFTKIFDRSPARQYQWLEEDRKRNESELNAYSVIECILSKLKQVDDPKETLERAAKKVWLLRGVDLDSEYRVPSLENPPFRQKTGRKSFSTFGSRSPTAVPRKKSPKAPKSDADAVEDSFLKTVAAKTKKGKEPSAATSADQPTPQQEV